MLAGNDARTVLGLYRPSKEGELPRTTTCVVKMPCMNIDAALTITRHDVALTRRVLRGLTLFSTLAGTFVVVVCLAVWWQLLQRILAFGQTIDYTGLQALGPQIVVFLQQYNPFFWWGVVVLGSVLLIYLLYGLVARAQQRVSQRQLSRETVQTLTAGLSQGGCEVLGWAWQDRRHPMTVHVLRQALAEMRSGRAGKIGLVREHEALLQARTQSDMASASVNKASPVALSAKM